MSNGGAALHLDLDPSLVDIIPANVGAEITSSTVFGSKFVDLVPPANPSAQPVRANQVIEGNRVTVEINTVFQQLVSVLSQIEPAKLNQTLGAIAKGFNGKGKVRPVAEDLDAALTTLNPSLDTLNHEIAIAPTVFDAYSSAAPDLVKTVDNATKISDTIVDQNDNLDALLVSAIGLADVGTEVLSTNRQPLTDVLHLLVPTTDPAQQSTTRRCTAASPACCRWPPGRAPLPGWCCCSRSSSAVSATGIPRTLPKVAATGGPQCTDPPGCRSNSPRRSWSPTSAPTRRSTATRASC